jgi:hypothetical protein
MVITKSARANGVSEKDVVAQHRVCVRSVLLCMSARQIELFWTRNATQRKINNMVGVISRIV